jgi:hypothetical protein
MTLTDDTTGTPSEARTKLTEPERGAALARLVEVCTENGRKLDEDPRWATVRAMSQGSPPKDHPDGEFLDAHGTALEFLSHLHIESISGRSESDPTDEKGQFWRRWFAFDVLDEIPEHILSRVVSSGSQRVGDEWVGAHEALFKVAHAREHGSQEPALDLNEVRDGCIDEAQSALDAWTSKTPHWNELHDLERAIIRALLMVQGRENERLTSDEIGKSAGVDRGNRNKVLKSAIDSLKERAVLGETPRIDRARRYFLKRLPRAIPRIEIP